MYEFDFSGFACGSRMLDGIVVEPQASESSSSTTDIRSPPPAEPLKESGSEPRDLALRSPDLRNSDLLKSVNASDVVVSEKSPEVGVECATLVTPQPLGKGFTFFCVFYGILIFGCMLLCICLLLVLIFMALLWGFS